MIDRRSEKELTSTELALDQDLQVGEGSELMDANESHISARDALLHHTDIAMRGDGHTEEEEVEHIELLLSEASRTYANTVVLVDDSERLVCAARLMIASEEEFWQLGQKYGVDLDVFGEDVAGTTEFIKEYLDESNPDEQEEALRELYRGKHDGFTRSMLQEAEENKNDVHREKMQRRKEQALGALKDSGKIALGVTAALLAVRFIDKNK